VSDQVKFLEMKEIKEEVLEARPSSQRINEWEGVGCYLDLQNSRRYCQGLYNGYQFFHK
jgi:hypothetical protein